MKKSLFLLITAIFLLTQTLSFAAKQVTGDVSKVNNQTKSIIVTTSSGDVTITVSSSSKLQKGIDGEKPLDVDIISISPGDFLTADVNDKNVIISAIAKYKILSGTIRTIAGSQLTLEDNKKVTVSPNAMISLDNGQMGKIDQIKSGMTFYARINPNSGTIWTLIITGSKNVKPATPETVASATTEPVSKTETTTSEEVKVTTTPKPKEEIKPIVEEVKVEEINGLQVTTTTSQMFTPEKPASEPILVPMPEDNQETTVAPIEAPIDNIPIENVTEPVEITKTETNTATLPQNTVKQEIKPSVNSDLHIETIELSYPPTLKTNDLIMVKVTGTEHAGVSVDIKYVPNTKTVLIQDSKGIYTGFIKVPEKNLNKAKIVTYMSKSGVNISKESDFLISVSDKIGVVSPAPANVEPTSPNTPPVTSAEQEPTIPPTESVAVPDETPQVPAEEPAIETPIIEEEVTTEITSQEDLTATVPANTEQTDITAEISVPVVETPVAPAEPNPDVPTVETSAISETTDSNTTQEDSSKYIKILYPSANSAVNEILLSGFAIPNTKINIKTTYNNNKTGILNISGILKEDSLITGDDGGFTYGPLALNGFFATKNLNFQIELSYADPTLNASIPATTLKLVRE